MLNVAVFGSGKGSNFRSILGAIKSGAVSRVQIKVVISNNSDAGILEIARANGIPALHLSRRLLPDENEFVDTLIDSLRRHDVNFIVLAGYMKQLHGRVISTYRNRIINIHPALLPKYGGKGMYGIHVHEAVVANKEPFSGATVHIVDEEFDRGAIVLQKQVALDPNDNAEQVAVKVLDIEHEIYPKALQMFADGNIPVADGGATAHSLAS